MRARFQEPRRMTEGKRPGGLTALAVINFVLGAFFSLFTLGTVTLIVVSKLPPERLNEHERRQLAEALQHLGPAVLYAMAAIFAVITFLLIAAGIGYLKQSKFWGRVLGNVLSILWVANTVFQFVVSKGDFSAIDLLLVSYPVLTLILINTTFKEDFV